MLRMILADDEPLITSGIKMLVDWEQLGIQIIGEYQDGTSALHGIMTLKPEIAILDISMPGMTGIDILKEADAAGIETKIIFLSGFQEFEYAREALKYGAIEYLLKPVKKQSLIDAIGKCIDYCKMNTVKEADEKVFFTEKEQAMPPEVYEKLVELEQIIYIPVAAEIIGYRDMDAMEQKLIRFSIFSFLEDYLAENGFGIVFIKNDKICIVLKGMDESDAYSCLAEAEEVIRKNTNNQLGFVIGNPVDAMRNIPPAFEECSEFLPYFFFHHYLPSRILRVGKEVFLKKYDIQELRRIQSDIIEKMIEYDEMRLNLVLAQFEKAVCMTANGDREMATYQYLSCIREIEGRFEKMGIKSVQKKGDDLLGKVKEVSDYKTMVQIFSDIIKKYFEELSATVKNNEKKDIIKVKNYIEEHYAENISLEILARYIHMNSFYFSSYFKKQTGENFKDYLNDIRMKHAMELLISTDMKTYEIADKAGFRDPRYFTELFQRRYGKTPAAYRKDLIK